VESRRSDHTIEEDFALDPAKVEAASTPRQGHAVAKLPLQPDGAVLPTNVRTRSPASPFRNDLLVYSDEIYDRLVYGGYEMRCMAALPGMRRSES